MTPGKNVKRYFAAAMDATSDRVHYLTPSEFAAADAMAKPMQETESMNTHEATLRVT